MSIDRSHDRPALAGRGKGPKKPSPIHRSVNDFWARDRGLAWLLVMLVIAIFFVLPVVHRLALATLLFTILFAGIILSAMRAMNIVGYVRRLGYVLAGACILAHSGVLFWRLPSLIIAELALNGLSLCFIGGIILYRVFSPGAINANRMMGAVAVYLVAGLVFADFYELIDAISPGSLLMGGQVQHMTKGSFVYFSYATLTTAGYGDVVPINPVTRSLAVLEAVIGQLYPAVFIGSLIALSATRKSE